MQSWRSFWISTISDRDVFLALNGALLLQKQISLSQGRSNPVRQVSFGDLRDATSNFDESRILHTGGFECCYWGILEDRRVIIGKPEDFFTAEDVITEIAILSRFHHRNIANLLGCCLETKSPLLVYEFVACHSLEANLRLWRKNGGAERPPWSTRLRIAMGVADALSYLHYSTSRPIVHKDVNPRNVVLDEDYTAKLTGFSISVPIPLGKKHPDDLRALGTWGYVDPEYAKTSLITEKADVFSFGRLLQDILTGITVQEFRKWGVDDPFSDIHMMEIHSQTPESLTPPSPGNCHPNHTVEKAFEWTKEKYLTKLVEDAEALEGGQGNRKQLRAVAELALLCSRYKSEERPTMKDVAAELRRINSMVFP